MKDSLGRALQLALRNALVGLIIERFWRFSMRWMRLESLDNSLLRRLSQKHQTSNKLLKRSRVQDDFWKRHLALSFNFRSEARKKKFSRTKTFKSESFQGEGRSAKGALKELLRELGELPKKLLKELLRELLRELVRTRREKCPERENFPKR